MWWGAMPSLWALHPNWGSGGGEGHQCYVPCEEFLREPVGGAPFQEDQATLPWRRGSGVTAKATYQARSLWALGTGEDPTLNLSPALPENSTQDEPMTPAPPAAGHISWGNRNLTSTVAILLLPIPKLLLFTLM